MNKQKELDREILKKRAIDLSTPLVDTKSSNETIELVEFTLASERYAIESTAIREIYTLKDYTRLPRN